MIKILNNCIYFDVVGKSLSNAFYTLGIDHEVTQIISSYESDDMYIIFTTHHLHERLPRKYISYNFEQLITDKDWPVEFFKRLSRAQQVWDYSLENINVLAKHAVVNVLHVPFGYSPIMDITGLLPFKNRQYDWLMLGAVSQFRADKLGALVKSYTASPEKYIISNNCWGRDLERTYRDSKIGINIHYYPGNTILEVHRIIPMVANRVFVVSERSNDPWYDELFKHIVTFLPQGSNSLCGAISVATKLLSSDAMEAELDKRQSFLKSKCSYLEFIKGSYDQMVLKQ